MKIDLKPTPVLQELIQDLENKLNATKAVLNDCGEYADPQFVDGIVKDVALLEAVLGRVIAQQELIDIRMQSICLN
jgi:hypothetical protein